MKRKGIYLLFLLVALAFNLPAQEAREKHKIMNASDLKGTYQVQFLKGHDTPMSITIELLEKIEAKREESATSYLTLSDNCRIKILPRNSGADLKMEEYVVLDKFNNQ